jgi:cytidylate kinase
MARLTIVSGSPGAGKTTFCARLAREMPKGLHIPSDVFYEFPAHPIDPTRPESQSQNEAIMHALGAAARSFLAADYEVVLDGIVGPWFLPTLLEEVPHGASIAYLLLTADPQVSIERVRAREGLDLSERVLSTHKHFIDLGTYEAHRFDTTDRSPDAVYETLRAALLEDRFALRRDRAATTDV